MPDEIPESASSLSDYADFDFKLVPSDEDITEAILGCMLQDPRIREAMLPTIGDLFIEALLEDPEVTKYLKSREEIEALLKPENYIGTAVEQVDAVVEDLKKRYFDGTLPGDE